MSRPYVRHVNKCDRYDCKYKSRLGYGKDQYKICDYIGYKGISRGCPPDQCDKYEKRTKPRKKRDIYVG